MIAARNPFYGSLGLTLAAVLAGSSGLLLITMLRALIGPFVFVSDAEAVSLGPLTVGLWTPPSLAAAPENVRARRMEEWRALLPADARIVESGDLAVLRRENVDVTVVSDARWSPAAEIGKLMDAVSSGQNVLLAGWVGVRSGSGWAPALESMGELLDVGSIERIDKEKAYFVAAGARGPASSALSAGQRVALAWEPESPGVPVADSELFWSNWHLRATVELAGAFRRREIGRGRMVWLGPTPESTHLHEATRRAMREFVARSIDWLSARPSAELLAWPEGAPFAALFAMDTETGFRNALGVAHLVEQVEIPFTFLVVTSIADRHPEVFERIAGVGEIGSHGDTHRAYGDAPLAAQRKRLVDSRDALRSWGVDRVAGFRPPYESYDDATKRALVDAGFDYLLGDLELESAVPRLVEVEGHGRPLVQIPRSSADDFEIFITDERSEPEEVRAVMMADVERAQRIGGLYYFSLHSQFFGEAERLRVLGEVASEIRERGAWLATAGDLARWWRARSGLRIRLSRPGPRRALLEVSNRGDTAIGGATVRVHLNAAIAELEVDGTTLFQRAARTRWSAGQSQADVILPEIPAGASRAYTIDYKIATSSIVAERR